ncbi:hypothetical protein N9P58_03155 [Puniceicoccaceae bacterium]|jgi:hypothetical protein|nr:hypothetical protein [Puniceicoccaceae bacterium]
MPADKQTEQPADSESHHYLVGVATGLFLLAALSLVLSQIGVEPIETVILASLGALIMGFFVYRERFLAHELALAERKHLLLLDLNAARINELYTHSVACLVTFDPGSLIIDRVSSGFFELLGISANKNLAGASLEEVLGVDSSQLTSVVYQIKTGSVGVREELVCQQADGKPVQLLISGHYIPQLHLVEAVFFRLPRKTLGDHERLIEDLERFKKGIVRREDRVLELKAQVNEILQQAGQPVRYQVDSNTDVSRLVKQEFITKKAVKHE